MPHSCPWTQIIRCMQEWAKTSSRRSMSQRVPCSAEAPHSSRFGTRWSAAVSSTSPSKRRRKTTQRSLLRTSETNCQGLARKKSTKCAVRKTKSWSSTSSSSTGPSASNRSRTLQVRLLSLRLLPSRHLCRVRIAKLSYKDQADDRGDHSDLTKNSLTHTHVLVKGSDKS